MDHELRVEDVLVFDVPRCRRVAAPEGDGAARRRLCGVELAAKLEPLHEGGDELHAGRMEVASARGAHAEVGSVTEDLGGQEIGNGVAPSVGVGG
jgi:hypothetical protein